MKVSSSPKSSSRILNSTQNHPKAYERPHKIGLDLIAGSAAGFTSAFFGHPLDTIKVRMQVLNHRFWSTCKMMVQQEGFMSLFKGVQSPLLSSPFVTAISFGSYEVSKRLIGIRNGDDVTFLKGLLAGGCAGFFYAGVSTPVELIKCRQQMEGAGQNTKTSGSMQMVLKTMRNEGPLGLYRGYWITCLRDVPGGAVQFGAYELFKSLFPHDPKDTNTATHFIAGGLAKMTTWFVCYPQDLIKTNLQCHSGYQGISECIKEIWARYGSAGFWKGSLPSIMRTLFSGALTFTVYEKAKSTLYEL